MKRIFSVLMFCVVLIGCFAGCGQKPDVSDPVVSGSDVSSTTTTKTTTTVDVIGGDDTTGTEDTTTGAEDTTTDAVGTTGTQGTSGTKDTTGTQGTSGTKGTTTTKDTTSGTKSTATTKNTTVTTTTTTKKTAGNLFGDVTTSGNTGLTTSSNSGNNKGYEFDPGDEWELYWNDEFNGSALDTTKWTCESGTTAIYVEKAENVTIQGGNLVLTARHVDPSTNKGKAITTGAVNSGKKFSFQYGRLEFRARLPYGEGVHPGLWTMGDYYLTTSDELGWPRCGEIDVMELVGAGGAADRYTEPYNRRTTVNLHWGANRDVHKEIGTTSYYIQNGSLADDYHVYACEWDEESITFYFDDVKISETKLNDPDMGDAFKQPHWIIMSFSLDSKGEHIAGETTPLPQSMYVDYVRVYKQK